MTVIDRYHTDPVTPWPVGTCHRCGAPCNIDAKGCRDCMRQDPSSYDYTTGTDWMRRALCAEVGGDYWFPNKGDTTIEAKAICARCPVRQACAEFAISHRLDDGVWGGLSPIERARVRRERKGTA